MATRRPFGRVMRRRRSSRAPDGTPLVGYHPGYYVRVRQDGGEVTRYAGPDRRTALDYLEQLHRDQDRLALLGEQPDKRKLFSEFAKEYLEFSLRTHTPATYYSRSRLVNYCLVPYFGPSYLSQITPLHVEAFLTMRRARVGPATCNRDLSGLSSMYKRAIDVGLVQKNPLEEVRRGRETQTALPLVDAPEQQRLLDAIPEARRSFYLLALETGLRLGEMLRLEWLDVDLASGRLRLRMTKAKRPRMVGLTLRAKAALHALAATRTRPLRGPDLVFPKAGTKHDMLWSSWRKTFKRAAASIGRPELRIHDLRHLAAINLVRAGLDLPSVQAVLGHTTLISTLRYAGYSDNNAPMRAAALLDQVRSAQGAQ